jgi:uroporphyrin-III C-methyltransferase/precorrin-2 dehydrogenase/sirohydrochlorin ferrochelatase
MRIISSRPNDNRRREVKEERIRQLSVLPVFYRLKGQRVMVAGGSDAAAWKAHLLAAAGAFVELYATDLDPAFATLLKQNQYRWHARPWTGDSFEGVSIAIADLETAQEAAAFCRAARASGVPVNVIDKPDHCDFQFGSIVNRSPAVVSISTDGAAPIFGQAIRRRIETLLPRSLQGWAELARDIRADINARLEAGPQRRAFWEWFVDRAFSGEVSKSGAAELMARSDGILRSKAVPSGRVTLVGSGPGDAELLTLKAVRALQSADVILFDDLVSHEVLELARREARRMLVGKRGGRESCRQDDINATMVRLARAGKHVVRLKGGDPMVFGRAGEEIACLEAAAIEVQVVPGITSALAMAAQLGVSLTHRDHAQSVRLVTGHSRRGGLPADIDWAGLADAATTTIFYMGGRTAGLISERLIAQGLPPQTPAVIVQSVARSTCRRWSGPLGDLRLGIGEIGHDQPVLIGVGAVFAAVGSQDQADKPICRAEPGLTSGYPSSACRSA